MSNALAGNGRMAPGLDTASAGLYTARARRRPLHGERPGDDGANIALLEARIRDEHARGAAAATRSAVLRSIEQLFPEPSDKGLAAALGAFWAAWADVALDPGDGSARATVLRRAESITAALRAMTRHLDGLERIVAADLRADIAVANTAATSVAALNARAAGDATTAQLLDTLATSVGAIAVADPDGTITATLSGTPVVTGLTVTPLQLSATHQICAGETPVVAPPSSAAARIRALVVTLPSCRQRLDETADALSAAVNELHRSGFDLRGRAGVDFFRGDGARGLSVALTDPAELAASSVADGSLDNGVARAAAALGSAGDGPDATYLALVGAVAFASAVARRQQMTQLAVINNVDTLKASVSGLSHGEKLSVVRTYQNALADSVRLLTSLDRESETPDRLPDDGRSQLRVTVESRGQHGQEDPQLAAFHLVTEQRRVFSDRQIRTPSDDPAGAVRALTTRARLVQHGCYTAAAAEALAWFASADAAYARILAAARRVRTLVVQALDTSEVDRPGAIGAIAGHVDAVRSDLLSIANTAHGRRPVFGGTTAGAVAYTADGDYCGTDEPVRVEIGPDGVVALTAPGPDIFGSRGGDLFTTIRDIAAVLRTAPTWAALSGALSALDDAVSGATAARSREAATAQQVRRALEVAATATTDLEAELAQLEGVDPDDLTMKAITANLTYQSALQTSAGLGQLSLVDFIG